LKKPPRPSRPRTRRKGASAPPKLLFIVDPWETLDHPNDTTLRLIEEARIGGARCWVAENRTIGLDRGAPHAETREILAIDRPRGPENIRRGEPHWDPLEGFEHIFYRTDPPVDLAYLLPLQILAATARSGKSRPRIHSPPESLFMANEKWVAAELGTLFPKSLVSASTERLAAFATRTGKVVLKPLYLAQSKGVEVIDAGTFSIATIQDRFRRATENGRLPVIVQEFIPGIAQGETRIWFVEGKLLAAVKKMPAAGESVIDMDRGGRLAPVRLSPAERRAILKIGGLLRRRKILFAAVDLIEGKITDFNHTSPGLLVPMEELLGENLARRALRPILKRKFS
jgi:glutathione synthase